MVYIGRPPTVRRRGSTQKCSSIIDPSLPVAQIGNRKDGKGLYNLLGYSEISENCRATYLDWLATGRSDPSFDHRYMMLFFYGLERRFVLDNTSEFERREILVEAQRLKDLYSDKIYVQIDLNRFIEHGKHSVGDAAQIAPIVNYPVQKMPLSMMVAIGALVRDNKPLSADWALSWLLCHRDSWWNSAQYLYWDEFQALFKLRFDERYPDGLRFHKPRISLTSTYEAASQEFKRRLKIRSDGKPVPDISRLSAPPKIAKEIADKVLKDLNDYLRYVIGDPKRRNSPQARALLPQEIRSLHSAEALKQLRTWARGIVEKSGFVGASKIVSQVEGKQIKHGNKQHWTRAADALAQVGFGFAPDPRFALRFPKVGELAKIFELGEDSVKLEAASEYYRTALLNAALGALIAHADGEITESERKALQEMVNGTENLCAQERRRLRADLDWMLAVAPSRALLTRKLKELKPDAVPSVRAVLDSIAQSDCAFRPRKIALIKQIYKTLGMDSALAHSELRKSDGSAQLVKPRFAQIATLGEAIPAEYSVHEVRLDAERIADIHLDTDRASSVLGEIFKDTTDEPKGRVAQNMLLAGLDAKHAELVKKIVEKDRWTGDEFRELCARYSLMASGAMENVNEWAFEAYDGALLDEYDGYEVNAEIADALKREFEAKDNDVRVETG